jgi:glucan biosynthesis protein C
MNTIQRIHGMDALRGIAMWLGVVLHAVIAYQVKPRVGWPVDGQSSYWMDFIYNYLHSFRMPIFFLVAGFFSRFLLLKVGVGRFINNRFKRIFIPFILCFFTIIPLCVIVFSIFREDISELNFFSAWKIAFNSFGWSGLYHIWFLYYLIIYYCIVLVFNLLPKPDWLKKFKINEGWFMGSTIFLFFIQYFFFDSKVESWTGLTPKIGQLLYYGYFYALGYIINQNVGFLFENRNLRFLYLLLGGGSILVIVFGQYQQEYWLEALLLSLQTNLLLLGNIALFMHLFNSDNYFLRYFSDSSYWFYLIHLPFVVIFQSLLIPIDISIWLKVTINITFTTIIAIVTYHYLVRYSFLGKLLNGVRQRVLKNEK